MEPLEGTTIGDSRARLNAIEPSKIANKKAACPMLLVTATAKVHLNHVIYTILFYHLCDFK